MSKIILFKKDYAHLSSKHFDISNPSFVRMYHLLKKMGIENNRFFLVTLDPDIVKYDPHNLTDPSLELRLRIVEESKRNPWYYYRRLVRISEEGLTSAIYRLSRGNLCVKWCYHNHIDILIIMPRQLGKTLGAIVASSHVIYSSGLNARFALLTKDNKLRKENVARLRSIRDNHPEWYIYKSRLDKDNESELSYNALNNTYQTYVAQSGREAADRLGKGMTIANEHWDEPAVFPNIDISYPSAVMSASTAVESAKRNNRPYGNILTTTASSLLTRSGIFTHNLLCTSFTFTEHLYDLKDEEDLHNKVLSGSKSKMIYAEFSYKQLGKTDAWFQERAARSQGTPDVINNDLLNIWTFGDGATHPLSKEIRDKIHDSKVFPTHVQIIDDFTIKWYIPKEKVLIDSEFKKIPIVLGTDGSENINKDSTTLVFVNAINLDVIGTCSCNTINTMKVAMLISNILQKFSNVVWIPERNMAFGLIDKVLYDLEKVGINPFYRIYNSTVQKFTDNDDRGLLDDPKSIERFRDSFGFRTTSIGRRYLYKTVFKRVFELAAHRINDIQLANQIAGLVTKNGRIDHKSGEHDDMVIAYLAAAFLLLEGRNIDFYSFAYNNKHLILRDVEDPNIDSNSVRSSFNINEIKETKEKINKLNNDKKAEESHTRKIQIQYEIDRLSEQIPANADTLLDNPLSITELKNRKIINNVNDANTFANSIQSIARFL